MEKSKCKNCGSPVHGKFCSSCGQKVYTDKDKSIGLLIQEAFHFLTHFEGKFFTTLKTIYKSPGKLSLDYCQGIRQKYYKPVSFYFLIVLLYLLYPLASGMNMEMKYYKGNSIVGNYMSHQIEYKLQKEGITEAQLSEKFHEKSKNIAKFLLLLLIPLSIPFLYLLYFNKKPKLFDSLILMTELNIFFLLSFFIISPILFLPIIHFFDLVWHDDFFVPIALILFTIYCIVLFRNVYKEKLWTSVLKSLLFVLIFVVIIIAGYKFLVFETTMALL